MTSNHRLLPAVWCGIAAILAVAATHARAGIEYSYTDLGTFGGRSSRAYDINEAGDVVGWARSRVPGVFRDYDWETGTWTERAGFAEPANAFVYEKGTMVNIGRADQASEARAINNSGRIVGVIGNASNTERAFRSDYGPLDETNDPGFFHPLIQSSFAWDINNRNQIVGQTYFPHGPGAFIYDRNTMRDLGHFLGSASAVRAINDRGVVVGDSFLNAGHTGPIHAIVHDSKTGQTIDLGTLAQGTYPYHLNSHGWDINNAGQVVGTSYVDPPGGGYGSRQHAFIWEDGEMRDLGVLDGTELSDAYGINAAGDVVGRSGHRAFVWKGERILDLNNLVDMPDGWTLASAEAINNRGEIVGYARQDVSDTEHAFLLTPLEQTIRFSAMLAAESAQYGPMEGTFSASVYPLPLEEPPPPEFGDADRDGDVDLNDLGTLATHYNSATGRQWGDGDFDFDGDVDLNDLGLLATHYGSGEVQARADFAALVPEPASASLLSLGLGLLSCRRRRAKVTSRPSASADAAWQPSEASA